MLPVKRSNELIKTCSTFIKFNILKETINIRIFTTEQLLAKIIFCFESIIKSKSDFEVNINWHQFSKFSFFL